MADVITGPGWYRTRGRKRVHIAGFSEVSGRWLGMHQDYPNADDWGSDGVWFLSERPDAQEHSNDIIAKIREVRE